MIDPKFNNIFNADAVTRIAGGPGAKIPGDAFKAAQAKCENTEPECPPEERTVAQAKPEDIPEQPGEAKADVVAEAAASTEAIRTEEPTASASKKKELSNKEITDHTAGLWKYLPVPTDEPEPAPEYLQNDVTLPGGRVIAARVRGKKHKHEGTNCDDWYEIANVDDVTFLVVSDGAGSKKFSRIGARESCRAAAGYLVSSYGKMLSDFPTIREALKKELTSPECMTVCGAIADLVQKAVLQARDAVDAAFYSRATDPAYSNILKRSLDIKDLSGTLLVAAIIPICKETKEHLVVTCQVGDGMIVSINSKGAFNTSVKLMGIPDGGEFSGETEFLTSSQMKSVDELQKRTKLSRGIVDTVMLMSDGVSDDYFPNETQMRRLYFDLVINSIIETENRPTNLSELSPAEMSLFKKIPDPIYYPWVNDKSITVPVQYTNRICEAMGISLEDLWENRTVLGVAGLELADVTASDPCEKLRIWLDNYYERGSFDDRTLVLMQM